MITDDHRCAEDHRRALSQGCRVFYLSIPWSIKHASVIRAFVSHGWIDALEEGLLSVGSSGEQAHPDCGRNDLELQQIDR